MSQQHHRTGQQDLPTGPVSIVADNNSGLHEVACLLAREGVAARLLPGAASLSRQPGEVAALERVLQAVQADAETEIIILVADAPLAEVSDRLLEQVRRSDKPTIACLLGSDPRLAWRAGAIPATRLDEAAMRATAWVRGWDQALVSSRLEEQRDQLAALAGELRARVGPGRRQLRGLFAADVLRREASLMFAQTVGHEIPAEWLRTVAGTAGMGRRLSETLAGPEIAVVFLSLVVREAAPTDPLGGVLAALRKQGGTEAVCIVHVCGDPGDPGRLGEVEARLREAGAVVAPSNAAAALLAGLVVWPVAGGG